MTYPAILLASLEAAGFCLRGEAAQLIVTPASRLNPAQRAVIAAHKPALLALVYARTDDDAALLDESRWVDAGEWRQMCQELEARQGGQAAQMSATPARKRAKRQPLEKGLPGFAPEERDKIPPGRTG